MDTIVTNTVDLLIAAIVVALIARRLALPYTVGLVIAGIVLALSQTGIDVVLTHDFIVDIILPPLLFEAAINIHWKDLRRDALPVLTLAILGTLAVSAAIPARLIFPLLPPADPSL